MDDFLILEWKDISGSNKHYYEHYKAVLENHIGHPNFKLKTDELKQVRKMLEKDSVHQSEPDKKAGLGPQDLNNPVA